MMSQYRTKPSRFTEISERPSTVATALKTHSNSQKSQIPKFRSLSQPPSVSTIEQLVSSDLESVDVQEELKQSLLSCDLFLDHNLISDEFKDCLDSVKLELESPSNTGFTTENLGNETAEEILNKLEMHEEMESVRKASNAVDSPIKTTTTGAKSSSCDRVKKTVPSRESNTKGRAAGKQTPASRSLPRKNSSSGIPVSMSAPCKPPGKPVSPVGTPKAVRRLGGTSSPNSAGIKKPSTTSSHSASPTNAKNVPMATGSIKRLVDMYTSKKRRYDSMRKDVQEKQKPLAELYNNLQELKKKLEDSGKQVADVEPVYFESPKSAGEDVSRAKPKSEDLVHTGTVCEQQCINVGMLDDLKKTVEEIRLNSVELCKNMMDKRKDMLMAFEQIAESSTNCTCEHGTQLMMKLQKHRNENAALEVFLDKTIFDQDATLRDMLIKLTHLSSWAGDAGITGAETIQELKESEAKIKSLDKQLHDAHNEIKMLQTAKSSSQECTDALQMENDKLSHKITLLEKQIESERRKSAHELDRMKTAESSTKTLKNKIKELETNKTQSESKINHLNQELRSLQNKIKMNERNYEKEIAELNKSRNVDKTVIERLNKDKSTFEARLSVLSQNAETAREEFEEKERQARHDLEFERKECEVQRNMVEQMRLECDNLKHELNNLQTHAKQTTELLKKKDDNKAPVTERECELQIEVVAQRAAIKALQEKVDANALEKIRFIETIEKMNGSNDELNDDIVKTLVKKEEEITQIHQMLKKRDEELANKRIENQNLKVKVEYLSEHLAAIKQETCEDKDLKYMIKESRNKLEEALMKSLENEHKMIRYEHELSQKMQQITKLENTVKLRDSLIGLLKTKKEELAIENKSLAKYSEEVRKFVIEAKEELKQKTEIINELQSAHCERVKEVNKLEKHVQHLDNQLTLTNEKRYKLQDTLSSLEKELQAARCSNCGAGPAAMNIYAATEAARAAASAAVAAAQAQASSGGALRYDDSTTTTAAAGRLSHDEVAVDPSIGLRPWTAASTMLYNEYKAAYIQRKSSTGSKSSPQLQMSQSQTHTSQTSINGATYHFNATTTVSLSQIEEVSYETISASETDVTVTATITRSDATVSDDFEDALGVSSHQQSGQQPPGQQVLLEQTFINQNCQNVNFDCCGTACDIDSSVFGSLDLDVSTPNYPSMEMRRSFIGGGHEYEPVTFTGVDCYQVAEQGQEINFSNIKDDGAVKIKITVS